MQTLDKQVLIPHEPGRAPICGFVTYISKDAPILLRRCGWEVGNDVHDDHYEVVSHDNGQAWSEPRPALRKSPVQGGYIVHTENAALYVAQRDTLILFTNDKFESDLSNTDPNSSSCIRILAGKATAVAQGQKVEPFISNFGIKQGLCVSFCSPMVDSGGRVLVPVQWQKTDTDGSIRRQGFPTRTDLPDVLTDVGEAALLIGEFGKDGDIHWRITQSVPIEFQKSSRGLCEGTIAELSAGRLAMILRGSNAAWPERPGYKWLSFSEDGGESWSEAVSLPCDDGGLIESSATGSAFLRSIKNGKLYWIGNLCIDGERANGNMPRSPLLISEVQEDPFALRRSTLAVIDRRAPHENPYVQHSNFKFYQDRATGDVVLYLTRYSERGYEDNAWMHSDLYQYRIRLD